MKQSMILLIAIVLLIVGCGPSTSGVTPVATLTPSLTPKPTGTRVPSHTPVPSLTPSPSLTTSVTSTVVPPLTIHKWRPKPVLVKMEYKGGDGGCECSYPPSLVLYANGRIILSESFEENDEWRYRLVTTMLSRSKMCSILNTIDQTGFLYYTVDEYRPQNSEYFSIDGSNTTSITVNAWRSIYGEFYALHSYLYLQAASLLDQPGAPPISPALRNLYYFLNSYPSEGLELYQSQRLGLAVTKTAIDPFPSPVFDWPFDEISLAEIEKSTSVDGHISRLFIVEGNPALSIYSHFGNSFASGEIVEENGQMYIVFARPILPYEIPQLYTWNILPDPGIKPPEFELECYPSDGVLPVPTPFYP